MKYIEGEAAKANFGSMIDRMKYVMKLSKDANDEIDIKKAISKLDDAEMILDELAKEYPDQAKGLEKGYEKLREQRQAIINEKG